MSYDNENDQHLSNTTPWVKSECRSMRHIQLKLRVVKTSHFRSGWNPRIHALGMVKSYAIANNELGVIAVNKQRPSPTLLMRCYWYSMTVPYRRLGTVRYLFEYEHRRSLPVWQTRR